jgi:hypothetical protein
MCQQVLCSSCKKITWSGCGQHLDDVFADVAEDQICKCGTDEDVRSEELKEQDLLKRILGN